MNKVSLKFECALQRVAATQQKITETFLLFKKKRRLIYCNRSFPAFYCDLWPARSLLYAGNSQTEWGRNKPENEKINNKNSRFEPCVLQRDLLQAGWLADCVQHLLGHLWTLQKDEEKKTTTTQLHKYCRCSNKIRRRADSLCADLCSRVWWTRCCRPWTPRSPPGPCGDITPQPGRVRTKVIIVNDN